MVFLCANCPRVNESVWFRLMNNHIPSKLPFDLLRRGDAVVVQVAAVEAAEIEKPEPVGLRADHRVAPRDVHVGDLHGAVAAAAED